MGSRWSVFIKSATSLETKIRKSTTQLSTLVSDSEHRVRWSSCLHLITHHPCPYRVWSISAQWDELRRTDGAESSLDWQAWEPAFLPLQLNEVSTPIQLRVLLWIITLSCRQTNPSPGVSVAAHCAPFSADPWASGERLTKRRLLCEPLRVVGHVTPLKQSTGNRLWCCERGPSTRRELWASSKHHSTQREDGGGGSSERWGSFLLE